MLGPVAGDRLGTKMGSLSSGGHIYGTRELQSSGRDERWQEHGKSSRSTEEEHLRSQERCTTKGEVRDE